MRSLYAYTTSLQHNIINNFLVMKYKLPSNWLFLLPLETQWKYICYHSFIRWFIKNSLHDTFVFYICVYTVISFVNSCAMYGEFPFDAWLKMNAREIIIFKGEINVLSTKIFENYRIFSKYIVTEVKLFKKILYEREWVL